MRVLKEQAVCTSECALMLKDTAHALARASHFIPVITPRNAYLSYALKSPLEVLIKSIEVRQNLRLGNVK